jgi:hypothetical protein
MPGGRGSSALVGLAGGILILTTACGASSTPSPSAAPPSSSAATFTSPLYGYVADLPEGLRPEPATEPWSGEPGDFGSDSMTSDRFHATSGDTTWAVGAPTTKTVDQMIEDETEVDANDNDCDPVPDSDEEITIGGEPARLTVKNCPVDSVSVIGLAAVVHGEDGFYFYFIHPEYLAPDPNAVDAFTEFLAGVTFP